MEAFNAGDVWMICTDAVEMGIDIPGITLVVQYGNPDSLNTRSRRVDRGAQKREERPFGVVLIHRKGLPSPYIPQPERERERTEVDLNAPPKKSAANSQSSSQ
ncbi:hypothetical protein CPB86DRAFT_874241 [Serendipita vermifera]|nr:hypothetical protein CPB86DRAFT_874241 [Serendipita vermifera]